MPHTDNESSSSEDEYKIKKHPSNGQEWFEKIAHRRWGCGALDDAGDTFSVLGVCRRNPKDTDLKEEDGDEGALLRGFRRVASRAYSTGHPAEPPVPNNWQVTRINELVALFRDVASAYTHFSPDANKDIKANCSAFISSVESTLTMACSKIDQL